MASYERRNATHVSPSDMAVRAGAFITAMGMEHHILVVDDDMGILDVLPVALAAPDITVHTAADTFAAVRILVERPVELIITDIRMPGMSASSSPGRRNSCGRTSASST
jgi:PleD family two-component response regulator